MQLYISLLLLLLINAADANLVERGSGSLARTANRWHRRAAKRSAGLAKDLRRAFTGLSSQELVTSDGTRRPVYCVNKARSSGNSTDNNGRSSSSSGTTATSASSTASPRFNSSGTAVEGFSSTGAPTPTGTNTPSSNWKLTKSYQGDSFYDGWDFFTAGDPTHGTVDYVDRDTAQSSNLIEINDAGRAVMRVETTPQVQGNRKSVRITTTYSYTGGLVLLDAVHMPTGCGTWPAFWSNGPDWPNNGEIDILEGVNDNSVNQATIHTAHGCTIPTSNSAKLGIMGNVVGGTNCAAAETGNAGCGMTATQANTYGVGFNNIQGGVYAMRWVDDGISVWFFPRKDIPSDIAANAPLPDQWGQPMAFWPADNCDPSKFFRSHSAIFDTTLCGDWAGNVWNTAGSPGQEQSCAARVGVSTCEEYVRNHGSSFQEAYWEVNYVKIFQ